MLSRTLAATMRDVLNSYILAGGSVKAGETVAQLSQLMKFTCEAVAEYKKRFNYNGVDDEFYILPNCYNFTLTKSKALVDVLETAPAGTPRAISIADFILA